MVSHQHFIRISLPIYLTQIPHSILIKSVSKLGIEWSIICPPKTASTTTLQIIAYLIVKYEVLFR